MADSPYNNFPVGLGNVTFRAGVVVDSFGNIGALAAAGVALTVGTATGLNGTRLTVDTPDQHYGLAFTRAGFPNNPLLTIQKNVGEEATFISSQVGASLAGFRFIGGQLTVHNHLRATGYILADGTLRATSAQDGGSPGNSPMPALRVTGTDTTGGPYHEVQFGRFAGSPGVPSPPSRYAAISGFLWDGAGNTTGHLIFSTRQSPNVLDLYERMRITEVGNVGIGTSAPRAILSLGAGGGNTKLALWETPTQSFGFGIGNADFRLHVNSSNDKFTFYATPTGTPLMTLLGTGWLGIGTQTPTASLDVVGSATISGQLESKGQILASGTTGTNGRVTAREFYSGGRKVADANGCYYA
jgi:hypothetical protein